MAVSRRAATHVECHVRVLARSFSYAGLDLLPNRSLGVAFSDSQAAYTLPSDYEDVVSKAPSPSLPQNCPDRLKLSTCLYHAAPIVSSPQAERIFPNFRQRSKGTPPRDWRSLPGAPTRRRGRHRHEHDERTEHPRSTAQSSTPCTAVPAPATSRNSPRKLPGSTSSRLRSRRRRRAAPAGGAWRHPTLPRVGPGGRKRQCAGSSAQAGDRLFGSENYR